MAWNGSEKHGEQGGTTGMPSKRQSRGSRCPTWQFVILVIAILLLFTGMIVWMVNQKGDNQKLLDKKAADKINTSESKSTRPPAPIQGTPASAQKPSASKPKILGKTPTGLEYIAHVAQTNNDGVVVSRYQLTDGTWTRVVQLQSKDTMVFETALDNQLALIAMTPVNQMLPPMPPLGNLEEAFSEAIKHPIIINETDSEKARELKEAVKDIRLQIADLLREGYTVNQILAEDATLRTKNVEFRRELQKELNEIYRTEGREAAEEYMENANEKLEEQGVIPLSMPESGNSRKRRN